MVERGGEGWRDLCTSSSRDSRARAAFAPAAPLRMTRLVLAGRFMTRFPNDRSHILRNIYLRIIENVARRHSSCSFFLRSSGK